MHTAMMLVTTMATGPMVLTDSKVPYPTEIACMARVAEMEAKNRPVAQPYGLVDIKTKCDKEDGLPA